MSQTLLLLTGGGGLGIVFAAELLPPASDFSSLQAALTTAVGALCTVVIFLYMRQERLAKSRFEEQMITSKERFNDLLKHHEGFSARVAEERKYWQETMIDVVRDNTQAMTSLRSLIEKDNS